MDNFLVTIKKHKVSIILAICFWIFAELFVIAPLATTLVDSNATGVFDLGYFLEHYVENIVNVSGIKNCFKSQYIGSFGVSTLIFTIFLSVCLGIRIVQGKKKRKL